MVKGWKILTTKERKHLNYYVHKTYELEQMLYQQAIMRGEPSRYSPLLKLKISPSEPCWECRRIAEKLGYLVRV